MNANSPQVVIVGAGFGGLRVARALARAPLAITLVDRHNYHLFQPLLYQVATAGLAPAEIAHPIRRIFRGQKNLDFHLADVAGVDFRLKKLLTSDGSIPYDYLVLAFGGATNFYGLQSVETSGFELKGLRDANAIRNHILTQFEQADHEPDESIRQAMLTFAIVGGGPTGVECSGAISELIRMVLAKDYPSINIKDVRVILLEASDHLLTGIPLRLSEAAAETLWDKHVEVRFGSAVTDFDGRQVFLKSGEILPCRTLIWAAGVRAAELADQIPVEKGRQGRLKVAPSLQLPDFPEVFVIGDAAYLEDKAGQPLPMVAPVAIQQANQAADNIRRLVAGKPLRDFVYKDPGTLATIGRNAAVAHLGRWNFTGFLAWVTWLVVHLVQLIGFRNRLVVLINWAWDYLFYDRAIRLIIPVVASRTVETEPEPEATEEKAMHASR